MTKRSATINALFPHKIAVMLALGLYLVLGVTRSDQLCDSGLSGLCLMSISWIWLSEENPKLTNNIKNRIHLMYL